MKTESIKNKERIQNINNNYNHNDTKITLLEDDEYTV